MEPPTSPMPLEHIRQEYSKEWVLVDVTEQNELHHPTAGRVVAHSANHDDLYTAMKLLHTEDPLILYAGEVPKHRIL